MTSTTPIPPPLPPVSSTIVGADISIEYYEVEGVFTRHVMNGYYPIDFRFGMMSYAFEFSLN